MYNEREETLTNQYTKKNKQTNIHTRARAIGLK